MLTMCRYVGRTRTFFCRRIRVPLCITSLLKHIPFHIPFLYTLMYIFMFSISFPLSAGSYAVFGSSSCTSCLAGYYATSGSSSCTACPANTYLADTGGTSLSSCVACTAPTSSLSGSSQCYDIPPTPAPTFATIAPTLAPSSVPTQAPTFPTGGQTQAEAIIYISQIVIGITASGASTVSFQNAFIVAVTSIFSVPVTAISGYTVLSLSRRKLLTSGVTVSYRLSISNANPNIIATKLSLATSAVQAQLVTTYPSLVLVDPTITLPTAAPTAAPTPAPTTVAPVTLTPASLSVATLVPTAGATANAAAASVTVQCVQVFRQALFFDFCKNATTNFDWLIFFPLLF